MGLVGWILITVSSITLINAQSQNAQEQKVNIPESYQDAQKPSVPADAPASDENVVIPESYQSTQEQLDAETETSGGTATYNIDDNTPPIEPGAADYSSESNVEELKVYSGSHDGNNYVKTVTVKVPAGNRYGSGEYVPK
jgi:hypothetical protein